MQTILMLIGLEGFGISVVILIIMLVLSGRRQRRLWATLKAFAETVKSHEANRSTIFRQTLIDQRQFSEAQAEAYVARYQQLERRLYQAIISALRETNQEHCLKIITQSQNLIDAYQEFVALPEGLTGAAQESTPATPAVDPVEVAVAIDRQVSEKNALIAKMEETIQRKDHELRTTRDTMEKIMIEYTALFLGKGYVEGKEHPINQMHDLDFGDPNKPTATAERLNLSDAIDQLAKDATEEQQPATENSAVTETTQATENTAASENPAEKTAPS